MRLVVITPLKEPVKFLFDLGYAPQVFIPETVPDLATFDPAIYGPEMTDGYLKQASVQNKKSYLLALSSFLTYRQRLVELPKFKMDALKILTQFSGHTFSLVTYWAYKQPQYKDPIEGVTETKITLKPIKEHDLVSYVNDHHVTQTPLILDFSDPRSYQLVTQIEGSLNNFLYYLPIENIKL